MKSSYDVALAASPEDVWESLTDLDAVVAALPGATLERDGDAVTGSVKTKLGVVQVTYRVTARADIGVSGRHVAVVVVTGREARGRGTLAASLTVSARPGDSSDITNVAVNADIDVTGRGAEADDGAWSSLIVGMLTAVLPYPVADQEPESPEAPELTEPSEPVEPTRPADTPAPPPIDSGRPLYPPPAPTRDRGTDPRMIAAVAGIVLLVLVWRRKRRK